MPTLFSAAKVLDREFLSIRCRLIDLAAALDRIDRAEGGAAADARAELIRQSIEILAANAPGRTERVQRLFSLPYEENWRQA